MREVSTERDIHKERQELRETGVVDLVASVFFLATRTFGPCKPFFSVAFLNGCFACVPLQHPHRLGCGGFPFALGVIAEPAQALCLHAFVSRWHTIRIALLLSCGTANVSVGAHIALLVMFAVFSTTLQWNLL